MAKRELMLVALFAAAGVIAWRLTAPAPRPGEEGFSFSRLLQSIRAGLSEQRARHDVRVVRTAQVIGVRTLAIGDFRGDVTVVGEDRGDVSLQLTGFVPGPDEAGAAARARDVRITTQTKGDRLEVVVETPSSGRRPQLDLLVRTPRPLGVSLDRVRGDIQLTSTGQVELATRDGDLRIEDVSAMIRGEHRDGRVEMTRVGNVHFSARNGEVRLEHTRGIECIVADGRLEVRDAEGTARLEVERTETDLAGLDGPVTIDARDSHVALRDHRHAVTFEGERSHLSVALAAPADLRATSRDEGVEVTLARNVGARIDLQAEDGAIRLPAGSIPVQRGERAQTARGQLGDGAATLTVRTERGDIDVRR